MWSWLASMLGQGGSTTAAGTAADSSSLIGSGAGSASLGGASSGLTGAGFGSTDAGLIGSGASSSPALYGSMYAPQTAGVGAAWSIPNAAQSSLPAQSGTMHTPQSAQMMQMGAQHSGQPLPQVSTPSAVSTYFNPLTSAYNKTISDWSNPDVGLVGKGMDVANTAGQIKNIVHGNGGQMQQSAQNIPVPQIDPATHLNPPDANGRQTFNAAGVAHLNNALQSNINLYSNQSN